MAHFKGSIREFTKYVGAFCRLKVTFISAAHKKQMGQCEHCGSKELLECAHVTGRERPIIISNILSQFVESDGVSIDLDEFEDMFVQAHKPISGTIKILCRDCHKKYDGSAPEADTGETSLSNVDYCNSEVNLIENFISKSMTKSKAIDLVNKAKKLNLTASSTLFSNINAAVDVWWLEPSNDKFSKGFDFILNHPDTKTLFHFKVPAKCIPNPVASFSQRGDSDYSKIFIEKSTSVFKDKKGFDFKRFFVDGVSYQD